LGFLKPPLLLEIFETPAIALDFSKPMLLRRVFKTPLLLGIFETPATA